MALGKDLTKFVRFGGLDLKNQKGYDATSDKYHSPPAPRGIYAMPLVAQEWFLLSSMRHYQPGLLPEFPKENEEWTEEQWKEFNERSNKAFKALRKEFTKSSGNVWHHLSEYVKPNEVIQRKASWVKTDIKVWQKAFTKLSLNRRYGDDHKWGMGTQSISEPPRSGVLGMYSKDECEVFFDEKV